MKRFFLFFNFIISIFLVNNLTTFAKLKVGLVVSTGGLGYKSFYDSSSLGLEMAKDNLGIDFYYVEPKSSL